MAVPLAVHWGGGAAARGIPEGRGPVRDGLQVHVEDVEPAKALLVRHQRPGQLKLQAQGRVALHKGKDEHVRERRVLCKGEENVKVLAPGKDRLDGIPAGLEPLRSEAHGNGARVPNARRAATDGLSSGLCVGARLEVGLDRDRVDHVVADTAADFEEGVVGAAPPRHGGSVWG